MKNKYIIGIGVLAIFILVGFFVWKNIQNNHQNTPIRSSKSQIKTLPKETTITLDNNGFSPDQVNIKVGSAVRWVNKSGSQETVNSDNYPTNQLHKELNFGVFNNSSSVVYTFTKTGIYGYHNQFHHDQAGKIIVTQ